MAKKRTRKKGSTKKKSTPKKKADVNAAIMAGFARTLNRIRKRDPKSRLVLRNAMLKELRGIHRPTEKERTERKRLRQLSRDLARLQKRLAKG